MSSRCLEFRLLAAWADNRLTEPEATEARAHVAACSLCAGEVERLRGLNAALVALGRAERDSTTVSLHASRILAAIEAPAWTTRLPLGVATAVRGAREFARPAFAASLAAMAVGLASGTWLAIATQHSPATATAAEIYEASNLLDASASGLTTQYFGSGAADTEQPSAGVDDDPGVDGRSDLDATPVSPAPLDSEDAR